MNARTAARDRAGVVVDALRGFRLQTGSEEVLQRGIELALVSAGIEARREVAIGPGLRIDFVADGDIGIEAKVASGATAVLRQVLRYAERPALAALILVTTRIQHEAYFPLELAGKPVLVCWVGGSAL